MPTALTIRTEKPDLPTEAIRLPEKSEQKMTGNILVLVNKEYPVSEDYEPSDMVEIDGSLSTNQNLKVKREAYEAYLEMLKDAQAEGLNFSICSAYRSYALQESLYNNSLAANGKEYTETMFAYPRKKRTSYRLCHRYHLSLYELGAQSGFLPNIRTEPGLQSIVRNTDLSFAIRKARKTSPVMSMNPGISAMWGLIRRNISQITN